MQNEIKPRKASVLGCTAHSFRRLYQGDLRLSCHESRSVKTSWGTLEEGIVRPKTNNTIYIEEEDLFVLYLFEK